MKLRDILADLTPESHGRGEDWFQHAERLWLTEGRYMASLVDHLATVGSWIHEPVIVDDSVVQDGHHRIVGAWHLGWMGIDIPTRMIA